MKEYPIIFNSEMVRAILDGRKTQTRRVIMPQPTYGKPWRDWTIDPREMDLPVAYCPFGIPGDRIWVRETFALVDAGLSRSDVRYRADCPQDDAANFAYMATLWSPSIHMPRWASRITLEIADVRVERVKNISDNDALAEGAPDEWRDQFGEVRHFAYDWFADTWDRLYFKRGLGWQVNPWTWAITFKRLKDK